MSTTMAQTDVPAVEPMSSRLRTVLLAIIAVALLVIAGAAGWLIRGGGSTSSGLPSGSSVDAGFAQDMTTHHQQAVTMAGYERDHTTDSALKIIAYDIETTQQFQVGEMQGWLQAWHLPPTDTDPMSWMGSTHMSMQSDGLMPGMATPAQMTTLQTSHGTAMDMLFLQLMIRHHQGGLPMEQYAAEHATQASVRTLAEQMVAAQSAEIVQMDQLLTKLGGSELPAPA